MSQHKCVFCGAPSSPTYAFCSHDRSINACQKKECGIKALLILAVGKGFTFPLDSMEYPDCVVDVDVDTNIQWKCYWSDGKIVYCQGYPIGRIGYVDQKVLVEKFNSLNPNIKFHSVEELMGKYLF